jgi:hypothetical protein
MELHQESQNGLFLSLNGINGVLKPCLPEGRPPSLYIAEEERLWVRPERRVVRILKRNRTTRCAESTILGRPAWENVSHLFIKDFRVHAGDYRVASTKTPNRSSSSVSSTAAKPTADHHRASTLSTNIQHVNDPRRSSALQRPFRGDVSLPTADARGGFCLLFFC